MTAKRFHKLFRSEMTKLMAHKTGAAGCIKAASCVNPFTSHSTVHSYQEMWDALRRIFIDKDNIPPLK